METRKPSSAERVLAPLGGVLPGLEALYKDVHAHPELSIGDTWRSRSWPVS